MLRHGSVHWSTCIVNNCHRHTSKTVWRVDIDTSASDELFTMPRIKHQNTKQLRGLVVEVSARWRGKSGAHAIRLNIYPRPFIDHPKGTRHRPHRAEIMSERGELNFFGLKAEANDGREEETDRTMLRRSEGKNFIGDFHSVDCFPSDQRGKEANIMRVSGSRVKVMSMGKVFRS